MVKEGDQEQRGAEGQAEIWGCHRHGTEEEAEQMKLEEMGKNFRAKVRKAKGGSIRRKGRMPGNEVRWPGVGFFTSGRPLCGDSYYSSV